jgi:hypothetical protein
VPTRGITLAVRIDAAATCWPAPEGTAAVGSATPERFHVPHARTEEDAVAVLRRATTRPFTVVEVVTPA